MMFDEFVRRATAKSAMLHGKPARPLVYVATPYGDSNPELVRAGRHAQVVEACGRLIAAGVRTISPISYTHCVAEAGHSPPDGWYDHDMALLMRSDILCIPAIDGWEKSNGVALEMSVARDIGIDVVVVEM